MKFITVYQLKMVFSKLHSINAFKAFIILLLLFSELASAQWNDGMLLLRPSSEIPKVKKRRYKTNGQAPKNINKLENNNSMDQSSQVRAPSNNGENPVVSQGAQENPKSEKKVIKPNTYVDLWIGEKNLHSKSSWWYKNYSGSSMAIGVSGRLEIEKNFFGFFEYETGFYYTIPDAKLSGDQASMKDERYHIGLISDNFLENILGKSFLHMSYAEKIEIHSNVSSQKTGFRFQGLDFKVVKAFNLWNAGSLNLGLDLFPIFKVTENPAQEEAFTGANPAGFESGFEAQLNQTTPDSENIFLKLRYLTTQMQFNGDTGIADPIYLRKLNSVHFSENEFLFLVGYQWSQ